MAAAQIAKTLLFNFIVDEVCHPPFGCFRREGVFQDSILPLPESPSFINTRFLYFYSENETPLQIEIDGYLPPFRRNKKTIIIVHGFLEDQNAFWLQDMVRTFLQNEDANLIVVEWKTGARFPYNQAIANIRIVGAQLQYLIERMIDESNMSPSKIHLIGFSLGAHLVGLVGKHLKKKNITISRITGLDPAGPYFEKADIELRLDATDAEFVDVIHSDSKFVVFGGLGYSAPLGHVDFYPNKGYHQPGCTGIPEKLMSNQDFMKGVSCSHFRAAEYFVESIADKNKFDAYRCENVDDFTEGKCNFRSCRHGNCNNMGYHAKKNKGIFYLFTNSAPPYAANHFLVKVRTGKKNFADSLAKLSFVLVGNNQESRKITVSSRYLQHGKERIFLLNTNKMLLPLKEIRISHNAVLWRDGWFLNKITVLSLEPRERFIGCLNTWLSESNVTVSLAGPTHKKNKCDHPKKRRLFKHIWPWG